MVDVHLDGMISIQLIGEVKAEGLTASELRDVITARLEETALTAPVVDVSVVKINSKHYRVYGGVLRPGYFTLSERTTLMDALSLCGFKDFAKQKKIELRRGTKTFLFNYPDYIKGKNRDKNISLELQDGDEIIVPE
jgi:polysaccharide export outer membrane protein